MATPITKTQAEQRPITVVNETNEGDKRPEPNTALGWFIVGTIALEAIIGVSIHYSDGNRAGRDQLEFWTYRVQGLDDRYARPPSCSTFGYSDDFA